MVDFHEFVKIATPYITLLVGLVVFIYLNKIKDLEKADKCERGNRKEADEKIADKLEKIEQNIKDDINKLMETFKIIIEQDKEFMKDVTNKHSEWLKEVSDKTNENSIKIASIIGTKKEG